TGSSGEHYPSQTGYRGTELRYRVWVARNPHSSDTLTFVSRFNAEEILSTNNNDQPTSWLVYAVIIVGCAYIITNVATQLSSPPAATSAAAENGPQDLR